jgi:hypothetical protein
MADILLIEIKNQLNKDIKNKLEELEVERVRFVDAAYNFCVDWVRGYAERKAFKYNLQVSEKLGLKLREFKHEVDDFCQEVPESVRKEFSKKSYWQHHEISESNDIDPEKFKAPYHFNGVNSPQILDLGIRLAIGKFGLILKKYGYLSPEKDPTDQWEQKPGVFYYPFPLIRYWTKDLADITESYAVKLEKLQELNFKLSQTIRKEREQNIKMNWY